MRLSGDRRRAHARGCEAVLSETCSSCTSSSGSGSSLLNGAAVFDQTTIDIEAREYTFRATGSVQKFDGYLAVYQVFAEDDEDAEMYNKALLRGSSKRTLRLETVRPDSIHRAAARYTRLRW